MTSSDPFRHPTRSHSDGSLGPDHGLFTCQSDTLAPCWNKGYSATPVPSALLCYIQGLDPKQQHTLTFTNGPLPGFASVLDNVTIATGTTAFPAGIVDGQWQ